MFLRIKFWDVKFEFQIINTLTWDIFSMVEFESVICTFDISNNDVG